MRPQAQVFSQSCGILQSQGGHPGWEGLSGLNEGQAPGVFLKVTLSHLTAATCSGHESPRPLRMLVEQGVCPTTAPLLSPPTALPIPCLHGRQVPRMCSGTVFSPATPVVPAPLTATEVPWPGGPEASSRSTNNSILWPSFLLFGGSFSTRNSLALARQVPSRHRKGTQLLHASSRPGPSHWNSPCALDEWSAGAGLQVGAARAPSTGVVWPLSLRLRALADGLQVPGTGGRAQVSSVVSVVSDGISAGGTSVLGLGIPAGVTLRRKDCVSQGRFSVSRWDGGSAGL